MLLEFKKLKRTHFYWISYLAIGMMPILLFFFNRIGGITFRPSDLNKINLLLLSSVHTKITFPFIILLLAKMDGGVKGIKSGLYLPLRKDLLILSKLYFSFIWMVGLVIFSMLLNTFLGWFIFNTNEVWYEIMSNFLDYGIIILLAFSFQCLALFVYYLIDHYILTLVIFIMSLFVSYGLQLFRDFKFLSSYLSKYFLLKQSLTINISIHLIGIFIAILIGLIGIYAIINKSDRNHFNG
jgi:hypothetical protein